MVWGHEVAGSSPVFPTGVLNASSFNGRTILFEGMYCGSNPQGASLVDGKVMLNGKAAGL